MYFAVLAPGSCVYLVHVLYIAVDVSCFFGDDLLYTSCSITDEKKNYITTLFPIVSPFHLGIGLYNICAGCIVSSSPNWRESTSSPFSLPGIVFFGPGRCQKNDANGQPKKIELGTLPD